MTLQSAWDEVLGGARFGDVFPLVREADRDEFRRLFVAAAGVPSAAAVRERVAEIPPPPASPAAAPARATPVPTGDACPKCGGLMVRTGTCNTCQTCGESSGGCS